MAKKPAPKQPVKPVPPPPKGQKTPAPPLSGKSEAKSTGNTGKPTTFGVPVKPALPVKPSIKPLPSKGDLGKPLVKSDQISAEMYAVGKGSRLCQSLMMALKHEGKPSHVSDEKYLQRFARYGWDDEEDKQAERLLKLWQQPADSDADSAFIEGANIAITTFEHQYDAIYQAMHNGEMTPSEARASLEYLRRQATAATAALDAIRDGSTAEERVALLETVYGYNIAEPTANESYDETQLERLAYANLLMLQYLDTVMSETNVSGIEAFRDAFSTSPYSTAPGRQVTVVLGEQGTDLAGGKVVGLVPLPGSEGYLGADPDTIPQAERDRLSDIYLGQKITTATIIHEFFHQLERRFTQGVSQANDFQGITSFNEFLSPGGLNVPTIWSSPDSNIFQPESRANREPGDQDTFEEIWADLGMTAVIEAANLEEQLRAYADKVGNPVGYNASNNAQLVDCALRQYLRQLLVAGTATQFDREFCS